jgi:hypothetical protein
MITIIGLDNKPIQVTEEELDAMSHSDLVRLRDRNPDSEIQKLLAPYEHQAFSREATKENPLMALPIALATPLYAGAKALGIAPKGEGEQTPASWKQVGKGFQGIGEGLAGFNKALTDPLTYLTKQSPEKSPLPQPVSPEKHTEVAKL